MIKICCIILNLSYILFNIYLLIKKKNILILKKRLIFKNCDNFTMTYVNKTYKDISNYLNIKYSPKMVKNDSSKNTSLKKKIILYSVDLYNPKRHRDWLLERIDNKFLLIFDPDNPDYLIFNVFGTKHLNPKYNNSIKIAVFTENKIPDLNEVDYAMGFSHINYLDRFMRCPIYYQVYANYKYIRDKLLTNPNRKKFCAAVISNSKKFTSFRLKFIKELNKYKKVDMGGKYNNNVGFYVENKVIFLSSYKFSIAMENSEGEGYTSEKIFQSFISGTIPIYYGNYLIDEFINPKSFILIRNEKDIKSKIEYIKKIDNDDNLYKKILKENVIINYNIKKSIDEQKQFFWNIFEQEKSKAYRRYN